MKWKIYYSDNTTYSDEDGPAWNAPAWGVQVIVQYAPKRELLHGSAIQTAYCYREDGFWYVSDMPGMYDYLAMPGMKKIIFGRTERDDVFWGFVSRADRENPREE